MHCIDSASTARIRAFLKTTLVFTEAILDICVQLSSDHTFSAIAEQCGYIDNVQNGHKLFANFSNIYLYSFPFSRKMKIQFLYKLIYE